MKKVLAVIVVALVLAMSSLPAMAGGPDKVGWKVDFSTSVTNGSVGVGANDAGSGFDRFPVHGNVDMAINDIYGGLIHAGSTSGFIDTITITPATSCPSTFTLNWQTANWDQLWLYRDGDLWKTFSVVGEISGKNLPTTTLDLSKAGSIQLSSNDEYELRVMAGSMAPVPEPSSMMLLMAGGIPLLGVVAKRRK